jgi:hypothetical protein
VTLAVKIGLKMSHLYINLPCQTLSCPISYYYIYGHVYRIQFSVRKDVEDEKFDHIGQQNQNSRAESVSVVWKSWLFLLAAKQYPMWGGGVSGLPRMDLRFSV